MYTDPVRAAVVAATGAITRKPQLLVCQLAAQLITACAGVPGVLANYHAPEVLTNLMLQLSSVPEHATSLLPRTGRDMLALQMWTAETDVTIASMRTNMQNLGVSVAHARRDTRSGTTMLDNDTEVYHLRRMMGDTAPMPALAASEQAATLRRVLYHACLATMCVDEEARRELQENRSFGEAGAPYAGMLGGHTAKSHVFLEETIVAHLVTHACGLVGARTALDSVNAIQRDATEVSTLTQHALTRLTPSKPIAERATEAMTTLIENTEGKATIAATPPSWVTRATQSIPETTAAAPHGPLVHALVTATLLLLSTAAHTATTMARSKLNPPLPAGRREEYALAKDIHMCRRPLRRAPGSTARVMHLPAARNIGAASQRARHAHMLRVAQTMHTKDTGSTSPMEDAATLLAAVEEDNPSPSLDPDRPAFRSTGVHAAPKTLRATGVSMDVIRSNNAMVVELGASTVKKLLAIAFPDDETTAQDAGLMTVAPSAIGKRAMYTALCNATKFVQDSTLPILSERTALMRMLTDDSPYCAAVPAAAVCALYAALEISEDDSTLYALGTRNKVSNFRTHKETLAKNITELKDSTNRVWATDESGFLAHCAYAATKVPDGEPYAIVESDGDAHDLATFNTAMDMHTLILEEKMSPERELLLEGLLVVACDALYPNLQTDQFFTAYSAVKAAVTVPAKWSLGNTRPRPFSALTRKIYNVPTANNETPATFAEGVETGTVLAMVWQGVRKLSAFMGDAEARGNMRELLPGKRPVTMNRPRADSTRPWGVQKYAEKKRTTASILWNGQEALMALSVHALVQAMHPPPALTSADTPTHAQLMHIYMEPLGAEPLSTAFPDADSFFRTELHTALVVHDSGENMLANVGALAVASLLPYEFSTGEPTRPRGADFTTSLLDLATYEMIGDARGTSYANLASSINSANFTVPNEVKTPMVWALERMSELRLRPEEDTLFKGASSPLAIMQRTMKGAIPTGSEGQEGAGGPNSPTAEQYMQTLQGKQEELPLAANSLYQYGMRMAISLPGAAMAGQSPWFAVLGALLRAMPSHLGRIRQTLADAREKSWNTDRLDKASSAFFALARDAGPEILAALPSAYSPHVTDGETVADGVIQVVQAANNVVHGIQGCWSNETAAAFTGVYHSVKNETHRAVLDVATEGLNKAAKALQDFINNVTDSIPGMQPGPNLTAITSKNVWLHMPPSTSTLDIVPYEDTAGERNPGLAQGGAGPFTAEEFSMQAATDPEIVGKTLAGNVAQFLDALTGETNYAATPRSHFLAKGKTLLEQFTDHFFSTSTPKILEATKSFTINTQLKYELTTSSKHMTLIPASSVETFMYNVFWNAMVATEFVKSSFDAYASTAMENIAETIPEDGLYRFDVQIEAPIALGGRINPNSMADALARANVQVTTINARTTDDASGPALAARATIDATNNATQREYDAEIAALNEASRNDTIRRLNATVNAAQAEVDAQQREIDTNEQNAVEAGDAAAALNILEEEAAEEARRAEAADRITLEEEAAAEARQRDGTSTAFVALTGIQAILQPGFRARTEHMWNGTTVDDTTPTPAPPVTASTTSAWENLDFAVVGPLLPKLSQLASDLTSEVESPAVVSTIDYLSKPSFLGLLTRSALTYPFRGGARIRTSAVMRSVADLVTGTQIDTVLRALLAHDVVAAGTLVLLNLAPLVGTVRRAWTTNHMRDLLRNDEAIASVAWYVGSTAAIALVAAVNGGNPGSILIQGALATELTAFASTLSTVTANSAKMLAWKLAPGSWVHKAVGAMTKQAKFAPTAKWVVFTALGALAAATQGGGGAILAYKYATELDVSLRQVTYIHTVLSALIPIVLPSSAESTPGDIWDNLGKMAKLLVAGAVFTVGSVGVAYAATTADDPTAAVDLVKMLLWAGNDTTNTNTFPSWIGTTLAAGGILTFLFDSTQDTVRAALTSRRTLSLLVAAVGIYIGTGFAVYPSVLVTSTMQMVINVLRTVLLRRVPGSGERVMAMGTMIALAGTLASA